MPRLLGERLLPDTVQQQRRRVRERLMDMREPVRQRRVDLVPGPDVIGQAERKFRNTRDKFVSRDSIISRIKEMRSEDSGEEEEQPEESSQTRGRTSSANFTS